MATNYHMQRIYRQAIDIFVRPYRPNKMLVLALLNSAKRTAFGGFNRVNLCGSVANKNPVNPV